ncbi:MAG: helix-turn-helix transcriptional regulator [Actinomycetota bacterium]
MTNLLALLLSTRRHLTFEDIRQELAGQYPENLAGARAAFERDKVILRDEGIPIESEILGGDRAGSTGYRILKSAYELGDLGLTAEETSALRIAVGALRMGQTWAEEALWKLDLGPGSSADPATVVSTSLPVDARLPRVHEAIARRNHMVFTYGVRQRTLAPFGLLARHGKWYVIGEDAEIGELRTFRLDRIDGDINLLTDSSFERPDDFDVRSSFPADPKVLPGAIDVGAEVARVRVDSSDTGVVVSQYGEAALVSRAPDGSGVFDIPCANVDAFVHWLLGFVDRAEVLEPAPLRAYVVSWLESMSRGVAV